MKEALEWFEHRLESTKTDGANFRDPIDWQKYGPLFFDLFKATLEVNGLVVPTRYRADVSMLAAISDRILEQMTFDLNR